MKTNLVLLHGGAQGGWIWAETIAALTAQGMDAGQILALDAPGCGAKRGRDTSAMGFADVVAELVGDIDAAGIDDIVLVGHSQAGTCLPRMAALLPDRIRRLVYVSCSAPDPGVTIGEMTARGDSVGSRALADGSLPLSERYRAMFCNDMAPAQAEAFLGRLGDDQWPLCCYGVRDWSYDHLAQVPSSFVLCLQDQILPMTAQLHFAAQLHADRLIRLDAGHQVMNTRPEALAEVLIAEASL